MKRGESIALALTWDGARWPVRALPAEAKKFLRGGAIRSPKEVARLLAEDKISRLLICWVPRMKGGDSVLAEPFFAPRSRRIKFQAGPFVRLGEFLGATYRRSAPPAA